MRLELLSGSGRSGLCKALFSLGSEFSAGALTSIHRKVSLSYQKIGESTQELNGHSLNHCPEVLLQSLVSLNTNEKYASCHL